MKRNILIGWGSRAVYCACRKSVDRQRLGVRQLQSSLHMHVKNYVWDGEFKECAAARRVQLFFIWGSLGAAVHVLIWSRRKGYCLGLGGFYKNIYLLR